MAITNPMRVAQNGTAWISKPILLTTASRPSLNFVQRELNPQWVIWEWEDGGVAYNRKTGDTHAIDPLAIELLSLPEPVRSDAEAALVLIQQQLSDDIEENALRHAILIATEQLRHIKLL